MGVDKQGEREAFKAWFISQGGLEPDFNGNEVEPSEMEFCFIGWQARASHDAALREELVAAYVILLKNIKAYYPANYCTFEQAFKNEIAILEKIKGA